MHITCIVCTGWLSLLYRKICSEYSVCTRVFASASKCCSVFAAPKNKANLQAFYS